MKICFFQIFKSFFSQPFLTMTLSFSTLSNQYCFIISLKSTLLWFSRNPPYSVIVVLRSEQILFLQLTTTFVHKISHNIACIIVPYSLRSTSSGDLRPTESLVPQLKELPNCFENSIVLLKLFGLTAKVEVWNKQQLVWFQNQDHKLALSFIFQAFPTYCKTIAPYLSTNLPTLFISFNKCRWLRVERC